MNYTPIAPTYRIYKGSLLPGDTWHQKLENSSCYHLLSLTASSYMNCVDPSCIIRSNFHQCIRISYFLLGNYKSTKRLWLPQTNFRKALLIRKTLKHKYITCWVTWITKFTYLPELSPETQSGSHTIFYSGYTVELKHYL